jgi:glycosyltransferase involved in cell wall biosynthesis
MTVTRPSDTASTPLAGLRVAMATTGHKPLDDRIFFKEARSLAKAGAEVVLIHSDAFEPPDERDGVVFQPYSGGGSLRRRLRTATVLARVLSQGRFDVVHCHEPDGLWAALEARRRSPCRVIFDSHEMWGAVFAGRMPQRAWPTLEAAFGLVERRQVAQCDAAIGASWAITEHLTGILGAQNVVNILNVPVAEVFGATTEAKPSQPPLLVCHDGTLGFDRGLKTMAEALLLVSRDHPVRFRIVGDVFGAERTWLEHYSATHGLDTIIERTGWLPYHEVGAALAPCHVGLSALQYTPNNIVTSSNKVFNYLLYGMPFIGPTFRLSKQRMVRDDSCGLLADSSDPQSFAGALRSLIEDPGLYKQLAANAAEASRTKYRWEHMEPVLFDLYARVLGGPRSLPPLGQQDADLR